MTGAFRARWTHKIHDEWVRGVLRARPDLELKLSRTVELMNRAVPDCLVEGYEAIANGLELPDPDDNHVLAAAIRCNASVIVTFNLKDFPARVLEPYEIEAQHPDQFIDDLFDLDASAVVEAATKQRAGLIEPKMSVDEFLDNLLRQGLTQTAKALAGYHTVL
jgi:hypothetical protein